jgi:tetratricopeptide (TPR) repeat protein
VQYSRQELKHDKLAETAAEAVHWSAAHRSTIIKVAVAALVIVLVVAAGSWYQSYISGEAASELGKAMVVYNSPVVPGEAPANSSVQFFKTDQERLIAAKNAFYAVSSKYGSTDPGKFAHYFAGLSELQLENYKVAEDQLKAVANSGNKEIGSMARFALASVYRNTNRTADAIAAYKQLIESPTNGIPKAMAQLELADVYATTDPAQAKRLYEQIAKEDAKGAAGQVAQQRAAALK